MGLTPAKANPLTIPPPATSAIDSSKSPRMLPFQERYLPPIQPQINIDLQEHLRSEGAHVIVLGLCLQGDGAFVTRMNNYKEFLPMVEDNSK